MSGKESEGGFRPSQKGLEKGTRAGCSPVLARAGGIGLEGGMPPVNSGIHSEFQRAVRFHSASLLLHSLLDKPLHEQGAENGHASGNGQETDNSPLPAPPADERNKSRDAQQPSG